MTEMGEVLLASDFTQRSDKPLGRAIRIAAERRATLAIAHVLEGGEGGTDTAERLRAALPAAAKDAELVLRTGSTPAVLAEIAAERASALIVTGVARYNSLGDYVLGTAVDHIVRHAEVPVLVVRRPAGGDYARMLVATDFSEGSRVALHAAARLFPETPITLVHAFHVPYGGWLKSDDVRQDIRKEAEAGLAAFLDSGDLAPALRGRIEALVDEGEIGEVVARQLERTGAGLLVLGAHGRGGFIQAAIGSTAEALLASVDVDVLMVRGPAA